jgi:hypothetical protein
MPKLKANQKIKSPNYSPREFANNIMHAASTGDKKFRADLAAIMVEHFRAETERVRVNSDVRFNNAVAKVGEKI